MFVILHGTSNLNEIKLACETGFSAVGFFPTKSISYKEIGKLIKSLPPFFFSMVTTSTSKFEDLSTINSITKADSLGITDKIKKEEIIRLKQSSPHQKIIQIFSADNILGNDLYRALATLSEADAIIVDFHHSPQSEQSGNKSLIDQLMLQATKPIIFAGLGSVQDAKYLISNYKPFGILLPKQLLYSESYSAREVMKELKLSYYHSSISASYPSQNINTKGIMSSEQETADIESFISNTNPHKSSSTSIPNSNIEQSSLKTPKTATQNSLDDPKPDNQASDQANLANKQKQASPQKSTVTEQSQATTSKERVLSKEQVLSIDETIASTDWESWAKAAKINQ